MNGPRSVVVPGQIVGSVFRGQERERGEPVPGPEHGLGDEDTTHDSVEVPVEEQVEEKIKAGWVVQGGICNTSQKNRGSSLKGPLSQSAGSLGAHQVGSLQIGDVLARLAPSDDPQSLGRIGGYEVSGVVGTGAMGVVLKAYDDELDPDLLGPESVGALAHEHAGVLHVDVADLQRFLAGLIPINYK